MSLDETPRTRVLIVEDSLTQAKKLEIVLVPAGFEVEIARDGAKGLERFGAGRFDLVLSDVMMPGLSGYELCRAIKTDPRGAGVPVVLLTSLGNPLDILRGLECGADNYVSKPFEPDILVSRIKTILANTSLRAESSPRNDDDVFFMGHKLTIASSKERILNFLGSAFEDIAHTRKREYENALAQAQQRAQAETYRLREELLRKEQETLRQLHLFLQSTLDALVSRIAILDTTGTILAVNAAWLRDGGIDPMVGSPCAVGANYLDACDQSADDRIGEATIVSEGIRDVMANDREEFSHEYSCEGRDQTRWYSVRVTRFSNAGPVRVVVAHEDITQRKAAEDKLIHDAFFDTLTGLPNRTLFTDRLERAVARSKRQKEELFAVIFLDLDGFKVINDSLGHVAGDELLIAVGRRLAACVRDGDTVARFGGDEFAILVNDIRDVKDALSFADRIQAQLAAPMNIECHVMVTTASIGIALSATGYDTPVELLRDADTAMYRAKSLGKARPIVFDQAMHTSILARLRLESDLRGAVERSEFRLVYQPIVAIETSRITGFEALVRWHHPDRGLVSPVEFIPVAEESGLIIPLGLWVLQEACRQMSDWQDRYPMEPPLVMSVNLSGRQFAQHDLIERLDQILAETGLNPGTLRLEITESVIIGHTESATALLEKLQRRGISLSMDDFGTGYSSLSYLHKYPFNILKIDRSFVSRMGPSGENSEIVGTIVALAEHLGMKVVAEGVETLDQVEQLRAHGCPYAQGYYYFRPLDSAAAEAILAKNSQPLLAVR